MHLSPIGERFVQPTSPKRTLMAFPEGRRPRNARLRRLAMIVLLLLLVPGMALAVTNNFAVSEDAHVKENRADNNFGSLRSFQVRAAGSGRQWDSYLKVAVSGVGAVTSATLRVYSVDVNMGVDVYRGSTNSWTESTITWNNAPGSTGGSLDFVNVTTGWTDFDVTSAITGDGTYSFVLRGRP